MCVCGGGEPLATLLGSTGRIEWRKYHDVLQIFELHEIHLRTSRVSLDS